MKLSKAISKGNPIMKNYRLTAVAKFLSDFKFSAELQHPLMICFTYFKQMYSSLYIKYTVQKVENLNFILSLSFSRLSYLFGNFKSHSCISANFFWQIYQLSFIPYMHNISSNTLVQVPKNVTAFILP